MAHEKLPQFPILKTASYLVRKFELEDIALVKEASKDDLIPLITSIPSLYSDDEGVSYIQRQLARYDYGEGFSFAIAEAIENRAIGSIYVGLKNFDEGRVSIGYWLVKSARGKGAVSECLKAVVEWARNELRAPRLELYVEPWNIASIKTAKSLGFSEEGLMRSWQKVGDVRKDMIMFSLIRDDE